MKRIMGSVYEIFSDAVDVLIEITGEQNALERHAQYSSYVRAPLYTIW